MIKLFLFGAVVGLPSGITVLAQETVNEGQALPPWATGSILGLVLAAIIITKQLVPGWTYREVKDENGVLKAQVQDLINQVLSGQKDVLPALTASTNAQAQTSKALDHMAEALNKLGGSNGPIR